MPEMSDSRRRILERRARFVAAAIASVAVAQVACEKQPQACLSVMPRPAPEDDAAVEEETAPLPCLEMGEPAEAGPPDVVVPPQPCLKVAP